MSRLHPFDVVSGALPDEWFSTIRAAEAQGLDATDRLRFHHLAPVRLAVRRLCPPEPEPAGTTVAQYETLLYAVYRYWSAGRHTLAITREVLERALATGHTGRSDGWADGRTSGRWPTGPPDRPTTHPPAVPHGACYLQLPERRFWARIGDATGPEPVDGMFLAAGVGDGDITVLAVLGLRPERGGFSQIAVAATSEDITRAGDFVRRPLFAPVLEGGERAGVKSLVSEADLLHLAYLALAQVAR